MGMHACAPVPRFRQAACFGCVTGGATARCIPHPPPPTPHPPQFGLHTERVSRPLSPRPPGGMFGRMMGSACAMLRTLRDIGERPDIADDTFLLAGRALSYAPRLLITSQVRICRAGRGGAGQVHVCGAGQGGAGRAGQPRCVPPASDAVLLAMHSALTSPPPLSHSSPRSCYPCCWTARWPGCWCSIARPAAPSWRLWCACWSPPRTAAAAQRRSTRCRWGHQGGVCSGACFRVPRTVGQGPVAHPATRS